MLLDSAILQCICCFLLDALVPGQSPFATEIALFPEFSSKEESKGEASAEGEEAEVN